MSERTIAREISVGEMAVEIGAAPADIPGLWNLPGYPELTTGQLLGIWLAKRAR